MRNFFFFMINSRDYQLSNGMRTNTVNPKLNLQLMGFFKIVVGGVFFAHPTHTHLLPTEVPTYLCVLEN